MLWQILVQFLLRLAFGLTASMAITSPRQVTAGFYRVHLWIGLGFNTFAATVVYLFSEMPNRNLLLGLAIVAGVLSYVGAVAWLYEKTRVGQVLVLAVTLINLAGAVVAGGRTDWTSSGFGVDCLDSLTSGLLLGTTFSAMLLGHWYLNTPTMKLQPLQQLVVLMALAVIGRALIAALQLPAQLSPSESIDSTRYAFLALRWLAGLAGVIGLAAMTWQTLKIPNTQSATGILYVAVIFVFLGELTAQILSVQVPHFV